MASIALAVNLVTYMNGVMHYDIADAANAVTNFTGTGYILSIAVAFFADTYIGRYKAIIFCGMRICLANNPSSRLKVQATSMQHFHSNFNIQWKQCWASLHFLILDSIRKRRNKSCASSHGADQFEEKDPQEAKQMSSFFNWLLLSVCLGGSISLIFIVWIQTNKGWDWGFGVSMIAMFLGIIIFIVGIPRYRIHVNKGANAMTEIIQVYIAAIRNRKLQLPENPEELYEIHRDKEANMEIEYLPHRDIFRFLDKAAIQTTTPQFDPSRPQGHPSRECKDHSRHDPNLLQHHHDEHMLGSAPDILCPTRLDHGHRITNHTKIPPASLPIIPLAFMIVMIPIYDRVFVPFIRKFTGRITGITHLQRIGVGLVLSSISMAVAGIMEVKRKDTARRHGMLDALPVIQPLPISTFWLSFQYFIFGIADMFTYVGLLEFFYNEAPKGLKSISSSFLWCSIALGYFFSTILVQVVNHATKGITSSKGWLAGNNLNRNHLNLFYWLLSILSLINFFNYLFWARWYKYRPQALAISNANGKA
ncbi:LOW QUALITY PROTEIN: Proton-dependent oligopeptide transporter family [Cinnamomum micranthum f. kanehirae]|uniref:Proton-dependent oligopeptide transporter family n=1 Tax=Cinnamomum micranthum f. kanehirae TaxID=337451 RepID=A0A3S3R8X2_9MAGN|nr:LOW QUALITY PROTEIN: Proton-dependent oligopeptide transporter family [Cinnamomum micranthum f. kanehirae]